MDVINCFGGDHKSCKHRGFEPWITDALEEYYGSSDNRVSGLEDALDAANAKLARIDKLIEGVRFGTSDHSAWSLADKIHWMIEGNDD